MFGKNPFGYDQFIFEEKGEGSPQSMARREPGDQQKCW